MLTKNKNPENTTILTLQNVTSEEERFKQDKIRDVYLLLENLALKEEATIKLIIDCLYDVGIINLINKKISNRSLNKLAKLIASSPKPIFRIIAWGWVKKNLAHLVSNWLHNKVKFK